MTVDEYNRNLNNFLSSLEKKNIPLAIATQSSVQEIANRIFNEGKKSDGTDIGQYDNKTPIYKNPLFSPNASGLKPTTGKTGSDTFKNGKKHKTKYIEGGYKEYKKLIGQKNDKVYLKDTNSLEFDFRKGKTSSGTKPTKINEHSYTIQLDRKENEGKIDGHNEKYGMITDPTKEEVTNFEKIANLEFKNQLGKFNLV